MLRLLILKVAKRRNGGELLFHPFGIAGYVRILRTCDRHLRGRRGAEAENLADKIARIERKVRVRRSATSFGAAAGRARCAFDSPAAERAAGHE